MSTNDLAYERLNDELLSDELSKLYPRLKNRETVNYNGKVYRRRFTPLEKGRGYGYNSRSKNDGYVRKWDKFWEIEVPFEGLSTVSAKLDHLFPKAKSNEIVEFEGRQYKRKFGPNFSRSYKTIHSWDRYWEEVS